MSGPHVPAEDRGSLSVADRVVHKIARQAAAEIEHTIRLPPRLTERIPGRRAQASRVDTVISENSVAVHVTIAVAYPCPIVQVTRAVRSHVTEVVGRTCSLRVTSVDVVVQQLRRVPGSGLDVSATASAGPVPSSSVPEPSSSVPAVPEASR